MMRVQFLPAKPCRPTVDRMRIGEIGYVLPGALLVTQECTYHLQSNAPVKQFPDDAASMHITRIADGYIADVTHCTHHWQMPEPGELLGSLPVVRVVYGDAILR